jgi:hypothetical protein
MPYPTFISVTDLRQQFDRPAWAAVDCRFSVGEAESGTG